jgi:YD repeat-containing protein
VYDDHDRVVAQLLGDGTRYEFAYTVDSRGRITATDMTERDGRRRRIAFDEVGYISAETFALGTAYEVRVDYARRAGGWALVAHCPAALGGGELAASVARGQDRAAVALVRRCWKLRPEPTS